MKTETFKIQCHDCGGTNIGWIQENQHPLMACLDCENNKPVIKIHQIGKGGGWYHITKNGILMAMARGYKQAVAKAQEIKMQPEPTPVDLHDAYSKFIISNNK